MYVKHADVSNQKARNPRSHQAADMVTIKSFRISHTSVQEEVANTLEDRSVRPEYKADLEDFQHKVNTANSWEEVQGVFNQFFLCTHSPGSKEIA